MSLKTQALSAALLLTLAAHAQKSYFADGYHGGVYGHYPIDTYTQFITDQLRSNPSWHIGLEIEPETWDTVKARTPEAYREFRRMTEGRQMEYTNPTYAQPYLYNIEGESIIRQMVYGMAKVRSHFPRMLISTYSTEEPCFTSCLPQVLTQTAFRHAVLKCPDTCWGGYTAAFGGELVMWTSPDGTRMVSVPRYACEQLADNSTWQTTAWNNSPQYLKACRDYGIAHPVGMCYQDAGWTNGPWLGRNARSEYVRWTDYIDSIADHTAITDYHFTQEDVRSGLMWGSQVLSTLARQVREAECRLIAAENIYSLRHMLGGDEYPSARLTEAWRQLMLAQHHDCWIVPYNRLNANGTWADNVALWTAAACQATPPTAAAATGGTAIRVYNPTALARTELAVIEPPALAQGQKLCITDSRGKAVEHFIMDGRLYFLASVPSYGYATYRIDTGAKGKAAKSTHGIKTSRGVCVLSNSCVRVELDLTHGGVMTSIRTLRDGAEYVPTRQSVAPSAGHTLSGAALKPGELYGYFTDRGGFRSSTEREATAEVVADNSLLKRVVVRGWIADVPYTQTLTLREGSPLIDINLEISWDKDTRVGDTRRGEKGDRLAPWYDTRYMLSYMIPTGMQQPELYKDAPFDVCRSRLADTYYHRWDSIKHNVVLNWLDVSEAVSSSGRKCRSLALLSDRTTSYSADEAGLLRLTLQYSGPGLWWRGYPISRPLLQHFALMPHRGAWHEAGIADISQQWSMPLTTATVHDAHAADSPTPSSASLITLPEASGYQLSSATIASDGSMLLRLYNASGSDDERTVKLHLAARSVEEVDLLGNKSRDIACVRQHGTTAFRLSMPRFGFKTLRIVGD